MTYRSDISHFQTSTFTCDNDDFPGKILKTIHTDRCKLFPMSKYTERANGEVQECSVCVC